MIVLSLITEIVLGLCPDGVIKVDSSVKCFPLHVLDGLVFRDLRRTSLLCEVHGAVTSTIIEPRGMTTPSLAGKS